MSWLPVMRRTARWRCSKLCVQEMALMLSASEAFEALRLLHSLIWLAHAQPMGPSGPRRHSTGDRVGSMHGSC